MIIKDILKNIDIPKNEIIFLHVKLKGLSTNIKYSVLSKAIIKNLIEFHEPKTILVPTFTYSFTQTGIYHRENTPSEVGRFSEEVRKFFPFDHRTLNPVFSVLDTHKYLEKFKLNEYSAFNQDSIFNLLHKEGHVILNINIDGLIGTYLHFLEFHYNVPYRYKKVFKGQIISNLKSNDITYEYYVRDLNLDTTWNRDKIISLLNMNGGRKELNFKSFNISWSQSKILDSILGSYLKEDKNFFIT